MLPVFRAVKTGVPFRETRLPCLLVAALFHLGCDYAMNLFLFQWIMLVGWMSFLTSDDLDRIAGLMRIGGSTAKSSAPI